jgi:hypothetical protein
LKRFFKTFKIGKRIVNAYFGFFDEDDVHEAMASGVPWEEPQYLFLDYDEVWLKSQWQYIVDQYSLRRALVIESSPERYWLASFTPMHIADICEIMFHSSADKNHCAFQLKDGAVYLRYTSKQKGYPRIVEAINNQNGSNFYNFDAEKVYSNLINGVGR